MKSKVYIYVVLAFKVKPRKRIFSTNGIMIFMVFIQEQLRSEILVQRCCCQASYVPDGVSGPFITLHVFIVIVMILYFHYLSQSAFLMFCYSNMLFNSKDIWHE